MPLFEKRKQISRREFRERLRKAPSCIPGSRKTYTRRERAAFEKELFGKKYGSHVSRPEYKKRLRLLGKERYRAKTSAKKLKIDRKIRYLKKFGGF